MNSTISMINAVIVEDEERNASVLQSMLSEYCPQVKLLDLFDSVKTALKGIPEKQPQLVFMDIMLGDGNAFDILSKLEERNFEVIFITAYDKFAIKAIKFCALDYLVKPISIVDLQDAVNKYVNKETKQNEPKRYDELLQNIKSGEGKLQRISLPTLEGYLFYDLKDIIRLDADGSYTNVHLCSKEKILVSRQLKEFESLLDSDGFFRVHHSHLINLSHIKKYVKGSGGYVVMNDGEHVEVASRRKEDFLKAMHAH